MQSDGLVCVKVTVLLQGHGSLFTREKCEIDRDLLSNTSFCSLSETWQRLPLDRSHNQYSLLSGSVWEELKCFQNAMAMMWFYCSTTVLHLTVTPIWSWGDGVVQYVEGQRWGGRCVSSFIRADKLSGFIVTFISHPPAITRLQRPMALLHLILPHFLCVITMTCIVCRRYSPYFPKHNVHTVGDSQDNRGPWARFSLLLSINLMSVKFGHWSAGLTFSSWTETC